MSGGLYDDPNNVVLADLSDPKVFTEATRAAEGVTVTLARASSSSTQESAGVLAATNSGKVPQNAAWARLDWKFEPWLNLKDHQALGVLVEGDGLGEIIAIRLESPRHISFGAVADRYITVDFTSRRSFTLIETESTGWSDYVWDDGKWLCNVYRETIDFGAVESVSLWYNNLPQDKEVKCLIGKVKALPMVPCTVKNPAITVNGKTISFPVEIRSGCYLEFNGSDDCTLYGPKGQTLAKIIPEGETPLLLKGENQVGFSCDHVAGQTPRVKVVVISYGDGL